MVNRIFLIVFKYASIMFLSSGLVTFLVLNSPTNTVEYNDLVTLDTEYIGVSYSDVVNENTIECNLTYLSRLCRALNSNSNYALLKNYSKDDNFDLVYQNKTTNKLYRIIYSRGSKLCTIVSDDFSKPMRILDVLRT